MKHMLFGIAAILYGDLSMIIDFVKHTETHPWYCLYARFACILLSFLGLFFVLYGYGKWDKKT